jgi:hypothetical protein
VKPINPPVFTDSEENQIDIWARLTVVFIEQAQQHIGRGLTNEELKLVADEIEDMFWKSVLYDMWIKEQAHLVPNGKELLWFSPDHKG